MFDLIGDVHGHANELVCLLKVLGYRKRNGIYRHPERTAIFLGDFIDRGPEIRKALKIVRRMVEAETALAVMGNHEWNALVFHTEHPGDPGKFLRRHTRRHVLQLHKTLEQLSPGDLRSHLEWFRTLPMWLDLEGLRVVHACWNDTAIATLVRSIRETGGMHAPFLHSACHVGSDLSASVKTVLKGKKVVLPAGFRFQDNDGIERADIRTRWYLSPQGHTYQTYAFESVEIECDHPLESSVMDQASPYPNSEKPLFIGHYWLARTQPEVLADNVACLDFSVAQGGFLCAYRWNGEQKLNNANFVFATGESGIGRSPGNASIETSRDAA